MPHQQGIPFLLQRSQTTPVTSPGPTSWTGACPFPLSLGGHSTFSSSSRLLAESNDGKNSCRRGAHHLREVSLNSEPLFLLTHVLLLLLYPGLRLQTCLLQCPLLLLPPGLLSSYTGLLLGTQTGLFGFPLLSFGLRDLCVEKISCLLEVLGGGHGGGWGKRDKNF